jgi:LacI family transcriptional regulator
MKRPTIKDVAREASCSLSTVSLVVNDRGYVSKETRERVLKVIKDLGYHVTRTARGLASKTSGNIGFILREDHFSQAEPFYTRVFLGAEFAARELNFYLLLATIGQRFSERNDFPRFLLEGNVDGLIVAGKVSLQFIERAAHFGIPIVLVDFALTRERFPAVLIDNRAGAHAAVKHLIECGHREIGFIAGDLGHPSIAERYAGFKEALRERDIPYRDELCSTNQPDTRVIDGANAIRAILARGAKPTAVFAANDAMAIGCLRRVRDLGMRIPQDLAIVGFDDIDMSSHVEPRLTTVRVFKEEMGKLAVVRLVDIIQKKIKHVVTTHVPVELVVRESTGGKPTEAGDVVEAVMGLSVPMK